MTSSARAKRLRLTAACVFFRSFVHAVCPSQVPNKAPDAPFSVAGSRLRDFTCHVVGLMGSTFWA